MTKTALITGAAGGIGSVVSRRLATQGYRLLLIDNNEDKVRDLAEELPNAEAMIVDLGDRKQLKSLMELVRNSEDRLDVAFINAAIIGPGDVIYVDEDDIDKELEVNLRSSMQLIKACAERMVRSRTGHIVATVSMGGILSINGSATYSATKAGLRAFLASLHIELLPHGVAVSGVYPSGVNTKMLRDEATAGGTTLNFLSTPVEPSDVCDAFMKALRKKKLEVYVPYFDSWAARLFCSFPWLMKRIYPMLEPLGAKGREKYMASFANQHDETNNEQPEPSTVSTVSNT